MIVWSGLLISCATPAMSSPIAVRRSLCTSWSRSRRSSVMSRSTPTKWVTRPDASLSALIVQAAGNEVPSFRRPRSVPRHTPCALTIDAMSWRTRSMPRSIRSVKLSAASSRRE